MRDPLGQRWSLAECPLHRHFGGVLPSPSVQEEGPGHACHATATGQALESETLPIAFSSLAGRGDFFIFFFCAMNGFCCKL